MDANTELEETEMAQVAESKGEYRGSHVREDADLAAWLAKRPSETAPSMGAFFMSVM